MKGFVGIFYIFIFVQISFGHPQFFDIIGDIGSNIAKEISDTAGAISKNIPSNNGNSQNGFSVPGFFGNAFKNAVDVFSGIGQAATQTAGNLIQQGGQITKGGIDAMTNVGKLIENSIRDASRKLLNIGRRTGQVINSQLRNSIGDASNFAKNAQNAIQEMNNVSQQKLKNGLQKINNTIDAERQLQNWANEERSRFENASEDSKKLANQTIDDFIKQREQDTQECYKGIIDPIQSAFNKTREFSESNLPALHNILDKIQDCMNQFPTPTVVGRCIRDIRQNVAQLMSIPRRVRELKGKYLGAGIDEALNSPCIAESRVRIERGKKDLEQKLDEILQKDANQTESTTEPNNNDESTTQSNNNDESTTQSNNNDESTTQSNNTDETTSTSTTSETSTSTTESSTTEESSTSEN